MRATEEELAVKTQSPLHDAERALNDKQAELAKLMGDSTSARPLADSQKIEIVALKTQIDALKERLSDAEKDIKKTEDRVAHDRARAEAARPPN